jgi:methionine-gamma-lyase
MNRGFSSTAIHSGKQDDIHNAHITPIYASSTYVFDNAEQGMARFSGTEKGYIYSRWGNPTMSEVEEKIAALETYGLKNKQGEPLAAKAILHASGMAAISTLLMANVKQGQKILTHYSLYGGTEEIINKLLPDFGIEVIYEDLRDLDKAANALHNNGDIALLYLETPANPTCQMVSLAKLTSLAHQKGIKVAVDNTFCTPYLQKPFAFGVDFIVHSTTKFLNGHGTAIGGVLLGTDIAFMNTKVTKVHRLLGGNSNPFDAYLLTQGVKTLAIRMKQHCENAMAVATFLQAHPNILAVHYPGLPSHPAYQIGKAQMEHPGALMSFEVKGGVTAGIKFINALHMCIKAVSLGTCDTLICHPASMTHYGVDPIQREKYGITDGLIRLSVGIENVEDIIEDISQALDAI